LVREALDEVVSALATASRSPAQRDRDLFGMPPQPRVASRSSFVLTYIVIVPRS
jgi:hypothetical protein